MNVDTGANPSAEGGEDDEGVDSNSRKVVDIVDTFRLAVRYPGPRLEDCYCNRQGYNH